VLEILKVRDSTSDTVIKNLANATVNMFDHVPHLARTKLRDCNNHMDAIHSHLGSEKLSGSKRRQQN
jgi:hypothetical protein